MRGNRLLGGRVPQAFGTIPADAGEPCHSVAGEVGQGDYPRGCGGTKAGSAPARMSMGLSPRMRGNRDIRPRFRNTRGTIPADAGEPDAQSLEPTILGDYPRGCGGTWFQWTGRRRVMGLSPRMRGNPGDFGPGIGRGGTIPADAGEPSRHLG